MGEDLQFFQIPLSLLSNIDKAYTFLLLVARFSGMVVVIPGIGAQQKGVAVRYSMILLFSLASLGSSPITKLPVEPVIMGAQLCSEVLLGLSLGILPLLFVSCVSNAGQLSSQSMGLQANAMMDPSTGGQSADIARLLGDLMVLAFLLISGHHVIIYALSGLGGVIVPGTFLIESATLETLVDLSAKVFEFGLLLSSPILVALLLTQFVMGLVSKAVPTVNIFIVSFPLTIGIGMILVALMIPEFLRAVEPILLSLERHTLTILQDVTMVR